ncbi:MAG: outer membrane lipoprotein-sorting protein, partial [Myxococcales bacterium]|nr:outer membrane lipoprotein-sorting protein [Myxococcales bacterium]
MNNLSRRASLLSLAVGLVALSAPSLAWASAPESSPPPPPSPPDPSDPGFVRYLLNRIDDLHRGESSHGVLQMRVKTEHWTRSMAMESWSLGTELSLIRILEPKKERGTATLKAGDDLFTFLNKTGRTVKITGAMMGGSWMGSHFTNDDLVKDTRLADDFAAELSAGPEIDGAPSHVLTLTPRPDAPVVWGRVEITVRAGDLMPVKQLFYDEDGAPSRRLDYGDFREIGGRTIATRITMTPLDRPDEFTEIR